MRESSYFLDILYGGVNHQLPGNGGEQCASYLTPKQRIIETLVFELFTCLVLWRLLGRISLPAELPPYREGTGVGKRLLLVLLCLIFGIEIGFKFATKQVIYLLNPCHILTAIQIYLLAVPPSKLVLCVFRVHNYLLFGALQAVIFPVVNTRLLPFEVATYWIQHLLILIIVPFFSYLMSRTLHFRAYLGFYLGNLDLCTVFILHAAVSSAFRNAQSC